LTELFCREIDFDTGDDLIRKSAAWLAPGKRNRFNALRGVKDRLRLLAGDLLIRETLAAALHCGAAEIKLSTGEHGKPYCANVQNVHFNLSHSGRYVIAALSDEEVGVDIEEIKPLTSQADMARVFMSDTERSRYESLPAFQRQSQFYRLWTAKESYIKFTGKGIFEDLGSISIETSSRQIRVYHNGGIVPGCFVHEIALDRKYAVCVCTRSETEVIMRSPAGNQHRHNHEPATQ
jgi:4'-phosphopantetheinyl transferase